MLFRLARRTRAATAVVATVARRLAVAGAARCRAAGMAACGESVPGAVQPVNHGGTTRGAGTTAGTIVGRLPAAESVPAGLEATCRGPRIADVAVASRRRLPPWRGFLRPRVPQGSGRGGVDAGGRVLARHRAGGLHRRTIVAEPLPPVAVGAGQLERDGRPFAKRNVC